MLVKSVHAKFGVSAAKFERNKGSKCEVPNDSEIHNAHNCIHYTVA